MRKTTVVIAAAVALVAMIAVPIAFAQHARGMHGEAFGGPMFLGHLQHLKQDLGLSDQQASDIKAVFQDLRQQNAQYRQSMHSTMQQVAQILLNNPNDVAAAQAETDRIEQRAMAAVKSGDAASYDYLVSKYMKRVVSIAWDIVRNAHDAEDLAQEAFVKAFQTIERFKQGEPFGPWIYRIVTNLSLDVVKHRQRFRHEELSDAQPA